jgi:UPF0716 protein FxsA
VGLWLFLIFVGVPILEIALFIQVGGAIGLFPTLGIVVLTAIVGTALMRLQGVQALDRLRRSLQEGGDPVGPIAHGALILVAGILLLTPGFFTDAVGLLLLVPSVRAQVIRWGASRLTVQAATYVRTRRGPQPRPRDTIDADYEILDEDEERPRRQGNSGWTRP